MRGKVLASGTQKKKSLFLKEQNPLIFSTFRKSTNLESRKFLAHLRGNAWKRVCMVLHEMKNDAYSI